MSGSRLKVQFIHGLEGSPQGNKARLLARHFTASTPAMDTSDFDACVETQAREILRYAPDLLVGSSFGGAVALELLHRGSWEGPTLLLAQAALRLGRRTTLPAGARVWLVHGIRDEVVDIQDSRNLAGTGSPARVRLIEVDDDHGLSATVADGTLVRIVEELAREVR